MGLRENQKEYWNKVATDKQFTTSFQIELFSELVDREDRILDVGCGYGRTLNELYSQGFKNLFGIDFSDKMIARGKKQFPCLNLNVNEDKKIPYEDNSFDSIILFAVLTCIIELITSDFTNIKLKTVTYTTMNGNKSKGFFYLVKNIK